MQGSQVRCAKFYVNCDILVVFTSVLERYMSYMTAHISGLTREN